MGTERSDELDRLLDAALATYAAEEPRPGLERRILARAGEVRRWPRWAWAGSMLAATVCATILMVTPRRETRAPAPPIAAVSPASAPRVAAPAISKALALPKQERFPSLAPLSHEEREWMALADAGVVADARAAIQPITIEDLTIPPLESEGGE